MIFIQPRTVKWYEPLTVLYKIFKYVIIKSIAERLNDRKAWRLNMQNLRSGFSRTQRHPETREKS